jgi:hypothetical protein
VSTASARRPGFEDLLLFPYLAIFVRQYFWVVEHAATAWILTVIVTAILWWLLLLTRVQEDQESERPRHFWLIVGLPLLFVYLLRAVMADASFDVLNYRLVGAERALGGWPFRPGDFLPPFYPLNPAPDMLHGIFRHLLGYRLGTVFNLCVLLWAASVVERILRPHVARGWVRALATLFALWAEHVLFLSNNYMVDFLPVPLMLEATRVALRAGEPGSEARRLFRVALLTGLAGALKPLYLAYAIAVAVVYLHALFTSPNVRPRLTRVLRGAPTALAAFLFPLVPYSVYMYRETGNPLFPLYNKVFRSPLWPPANLYDGRWGPKTAFEMLHWPLRVAFDSTGTGELAVYSGRVSLVLVAAVLCLTLAWRERRLRALSLATVAGAYLWAVVLTGYARYAVFVEVLGAVTTIGLVAFLWSRQRANGMRVLPTVISGVLMLLAGVQAARASVYILQRDWGGRPSVFSDWAAYKSEARFVLRDYRLEKFLGEKEKALFAGVGAWVEAGTLVSGFQSLVSPDAPILCAYVHDYFYHPDGRELFARALTHSAGRRVSALCVDSDLVACRRVLAERGLEITAEVPVTMPIYSHRSRLRMYYFELRVGGSQAP